MLKTKTNKLIKEADLRPYDLFQKSIVLYGPSKSGKSTAMADLMSKLKDLINLVLLISPTEEMSNTFKGMIPSLCMRSKMEIPHPDGKKERKNLPIERYLHDLLERQEAATKLYKESNSIPLLKALFEHIGEKNRYECNKKIQLFDKMRDKIYHLIKKSKDSEAIKINNEKLVDEMYSDNIKRCYREYLDKDDRVIQKLYESNKLSKNEQKCYLFKNANPNLLLILDDCSDDFVEYCKMAEFKALFYKARHYSVTILISCQGDFDLAASLRKNAMISIYTTSSAAQSAMENKSNSFTKLTAAKALDALPVIYDDSVKYRHLLYFRERDEIYYYKADLVVPFKFGSKNLWDLCDELEEDEYETESSNKYYTMMLNSKK